jgi:short-subunit dehydrogenase
MNIRSSNVARRRGRILNVASIVGYQPGGPGMAVYYATKAYVLSFTKGLAFELAGTGVSVTALCPGRFRFRGRGGSQTFLYRWVPQARPDAVAKAGYRANEGTSNGHSGVHREVVRFRWRTPAARHSAVRKSMVVEAPR